MGRSVYIVGTGNVGTGLCLALGETPYDVIGAYNRGTQRQQRAVELTGLEIAASLEDPRLRQADIVFVCVTDDAIKTIADDLRQRSLKPGAIVAHTSGAQPASALEGFDSSMVGSMHPMAACPTPNQAKAALATAHYVIEGDDDACQTLKMLVAALGGKASTITSSQKPRYHAACVLASNLMVALLEVADREAKSAGLDDSTALTDLALGALRNVRQLGATKGLTGPIKRGDLATIRSHLAVLESEQRDIYCRLSEIAVELATQDGLSDESAELLRKELLSSR